MRGTLGRRLMPAVTEYCTVEDIGTWGIYHLGLEGLSRAARIVPAILGASRKIDSYLRSRFTLPLTAVGDDIRRACAILAACDLAVALGLPLEQRGILDRRCKDVEAWLALINQGLAVPDVIDSSPGAQQGVAGGGPQVESNEQRGWFDENASDGVGPFVGARP